MTGLLATQGFRLGEQRVGESLQKVNPSYSRARKANTARLLNPVPYRADYFGHKLHIAYYSEVWTMGSTKGRSWTLMLFEQEQLAHLRGNCSRAHLTCKQHPSRLVASQRM